jgi:prepilin-type processing-associated H-X9-DG protein
MRRRTDLVVLAFILLTAGTLVIAGVAKVRDAARRVNCFNNLRQLGSSLKDYEDQQGHFPPAAMPNADLPPEKRLSWLLAIEPYVEAGDLYYRTDKKKSWDAEENAPVAAVPFRVYRCPAASPEGSPFAGLYPASYIGVTGLGDGTALLAKGDPRAGFFGYDRDLTAEDVRGRANMLAAVETARVEGSWLAAGPATVRGLEPGGPPYLGVGGQFGGLHQGRTNALFADGSARSLGAGVAPEVLEALATIAGSKGADRVGE